MLKTLIIAGEPDAADRLRQLVERCCGELAQVAETHLSPEPAIEAILAGRPHLVFLDIELPSLSGFELLDRLQGIPLEVVITSASKEHAAQAFKYAAVDFLTKPFGCVEVRRAVERCHLKVSEQEKRLELEARLSSSHHGNGGSDATLPLHTEEGIVFLKAADVVRLEAQGGYTKFFLKSGETVLASKTLKDWEAFFQEHLFCRVHESHLVNLRCVWKFLKKDGGELVLTDHSTVRVARRRKDDLLKRLSGLRWAFSA